MNRLWLLIGFVALGIGVLVFVHHQNRLLSQEWEKMRSTPVGEIRASAASKKQVAGTTRNIPRIDPVNDPLAPVALKTSAPAPKEPPSQTPKKVYDFPVDGTALVQ